MPERSPKGPEEAPIYIGQLERTTNSLRKMKGNVFKFKHGVPSTEESAGGISENLVVGDSEIFAVLLKNG